MHRDIEVDILKHRNEHIVKLGQLVNNLHALEFLLRTFLLTKQHLSGEPIPNLHSAKEGDWVPLNPFTNYDTLGELIKKFNNVIQTSHPEALIDSSVIKVRDAIAHGRVAGETPSPPMTLVKFSKKSKNGKVQITTKIIMDLAWFKANIDLVLKQIKKIVPLLKNVEKVQ